MKLNRTFAAAGLAVLLIMAITLPAQAFPDVSAHWAKIPIDHLHSRGLVNGYPDGLFYPQKFVTREEFATLLVQALGEAGEARALQSGTSQFEDVAGRWSQGFVELTWEKGVVYGDGAGNFSPAQIVTREEAVTMLVKAVGSNLPLAEEPFSFTDDSMIAGWARNSVNLAVSQGLIAGFPDGSFRPRQGLTRAQAVVMLEQFLDLRGQKYQFYGTLTNINLLLKQATIGINGIPRKFDLSNHLYFYNQLTGEAVTEIGLPAQIIFDVNREGKLAFALLVSENPAGRVNIRLQSQPQGQKPVQLVNTVVKLSLEETINKEEPIINPADSLAETRFAMKVDAFEKATGASGLGQLVAVIDSGIDAGHPDLQKTPQGYAKVVDYLDFTDEGKIPIVDEVKKVDDKITIADRKVSVAGIYNLSNEFAYGWLDLNSCPLMLENASNNRRMVVAVANNYYDLYDTVYVDTNGDGQILDEKPIGIYSTDRKVISIAGSGKRKMNLALCEISSEKGYIKFGFDALGHGTEIAGVVAASGTVKGVAPGAQILVLKVLDRNGKGKIASLHSALQAAARRGARVAVVSMGQYQLTQNEQKQLANLIELLWKENHMLICMAAGNNGPGLNTVAGTAALPNIISVGAYANPFMWDKDYGWKVERSTLWYFSSAGPASDGTMVPMLVAPGSAVSTYPMWADRPYRLDEGTSMAAPHVAGAIALLMDAVTHKLYKNDTMAVYQALISGAEPLESYQAAEQGYGAVNLLRSWMLLRDMKDDIIALGATQFSPNYGYGQGLYSRGITPAQSVVQLENNTVTNRQLAIGGLAEWIKPSQFSMQLPQQGQRKLLVDYEISGEPGLYSDFLIADDMETPGVDLSILQTVIVPYNLDKLKDRKLELNESLKAAAFKRYFVQVPEESGNLAINLAVASGRARMHVISPSGWQDISNYAGQGKTQTDPQVNLTYNLPEAGTWEVVVYSSASLSDLGESESQYTLQALLQDIQPAVITPPDDRYLVSSLPRILRPGEKNLISIGFWNSVTKTAGEGVVMIDGKMYELRNGMVLLPIIPTTDTVNLTVSW